MIEHIRTFLGYCGQCNEPTVVGEFKLHGWKHVFTICNPCIKKLTDCTIQYETEEKKKS